MKQLEAPLPGDDSFNQYDNPYNKSEKDRLFTEFGLKRSDTSKFKLGLGSGIVSLYGVEKHILQMEVVIMIYSKHSTHYTRPNWQPGKMTFGDEVYPSRWKREKMWLLTCTYFPPVKAHVDSVIP